MNQSKNFQHGYGQIMFQRSGLIVDEALRSWAKKQGAAYRDQKSRMRNAAKAEVYAGAIRALSEISLMEDSARVPSYCVGPDDPSVRPFELNRRSR